MGGKNILPMKALSVELEAAGLSKVTTYIQSGNIVFQDEKRTKSALSELIRRIIKNEFGFEVPVIIISDKELSAGLKGNPFTKLMSDGDSKRVHLFFMNENPINLRKDRIEVLQMEGEEWKLKGLVFYLFAPDGFGKSKLATQIEKILGVPATARNWLTVNKLLEIASQENK